MPLSPSTGPSVISAVPSPFTASGDLDLTGARRVFERVAASEVDALMIAGTTGEFPTLSDEERLRLVELGLEVAGPDRIIAHVGGASAHQAVATTRSATAAGATHLAALTPYYLTGSDAAIRSYFEAVTAAAGNAKVYAYLFPGLTNVQLTPTVTAEIIRETGMAGAKLSIPGVSFLEELVPLLPEGSLVWSGNDALLPEVVAVGGSGIVSGVSPAAPELFAAQAAAVGRGDAEALETLTPLVQRTVSAVGPSLAFLKTALEQLGVIESATIRTAIDAPDAEQRAAITAVLDELAARR